MNVGVLEILSGSVPQNWIERLYNGQLRRHYASIAPQAVAVWCRQLGHTIHYATYYGQQDPKSLLPGWLDVVFISTYTQASAVAYALSKLYRKENTLTVIGGPHAKSFPLDCLRFFDIVVQDCDKSLIEDILQGSYDRYTIANSGRRIGSIPSVAERLPEISIASFIRGRPALFSNIPILTSLGCPYRCDFCLDWANPYELFPPEQVAADLNYISKQMPGVMISYHDPSFGVKFEQVMDIIENVPKKARNPYIMQTSLSTLQGSRMRRLQESNCVYAAPGIESWADYSLKAGVGSISGKKKLEKVVSHLKELHQHVPGLQINFMLGTDVDEGDEPVELTKECIRQVPFVWPIINIPTAFGGTPLHERYLSDDRILRSMPFSFYYTPYLVTTLIKYTPEEYYEKLIDIYRLATSGNMMLRRLLVTRKRGLKTLHTLRTFVFRNQLAQLRRIRQEFKTNNHFKAFHDGGSKELPAFYHRLYRQRLGKYAELITEEEMIPELEPLSSSVSLLASSG